MPTRNEGRRAFAREFRLKEFELLRQEIMARSAEQVTMEQQAAIGAAAIYSIIAGLRETSDAFKQLFPILWWIPIPLLMFGYFRWKANEEMIGRIADYLKGTEKSAGVIGWELATKTHNRHAIYWKLIRATWILAILGAFILALAETFPKACTMSGTGSDRVLTCHL